MVELEKLDPAEILRTAQRLRARIAERFPSAGLIGVADQLVELASRAGATCEELARPNTKLRLAVGAGIALLLVASVSAAVLGLTSAAPGHRVSWADLVQVAEAGANDLVLLGAAIYFFVSFETRLKRGKVVKALHQLRTLAHLIDAHQLTKNPEVLGHEELRTKSSPERRLTAFELGRYLDYCTEMLSLTGKIAALYGDGFDDSESLEAVNEIEEITVGLQGKIWQKLILLQAISPAVLARPAPRVEAGDVLAATEAPPSGPDEASASTAAAAHQDADAIDLAALAEEPAAPRAPMIGENSDAIDSIERAIAGAADAQPPPTQTTTEDDE